MPHNRTSDRNDPDGDLQGVRPAPRHRANELPEVELITRMPGSPRWTGVVLRRDGEYSTVFWSDGAISGARTQFLIPKVTT